MHLELIDKNESMYIILFGYSVLLIRACQKNFIFQKLKIVIKIWNLVYVERRQAVKLKISIGRTSDTGKRLYIA